MQNQNPVIKNYILSSEKYMLKYQTSYKSVAELIFCKNFNFSDKIFKIKIYDIK